MKRLCQLVVRNTGAWKGQDWHICPMFERGSNMTKNVNLISQLMHIMIHHTTHLGTNYCYFITYHFCV